MKPKKYNLLLVEDNELDILLFSEYFKCLEHMWNLHIVSDGAQALKTLDKLKQAPDLIISDLHMPKINGLDLLMLVRACSGWQHIPVVILSGSDAPQEQERASQLNVLKYMRKPYGPSAYRDAFEDIFLTWASYMEEKEREKALAEGNKLAAA